MLLYLICIMYISMYLTHTDIHRMGKIAYESSNRSYTETV